MIPYETIPTAIRMAINDLPDLLVERSGSIFYSGKEAYLGPAQLYVLGLNPGGTPSDDPNTTIGAHLDRFKDLDGPWSEYRDESWEGAERGCWGLQPQILHLLKNLGLDPRLVPSSNVVFARSRGEADLGHAKAQLLQSCWPVHQAVIDSLGIRIIVCFGNTAGAWTRAQLGASELVDIYSEENNRGWSSKTHRNPDGIQVLTLTHPSRANWTNPNSDPSPLVLRAIERDL